MTLRANSAPLVERALSSNGTADSNSETDGSSFHRSPRSRLQAFSASGEVAAGPHHYESNMMAAGASMSKGSNSSAWASEHSSLKGIPLQRHDPAQNQAGAGRTWREALEQYPGLLELYPLAAPLDETAESIPSCTPRNSMEPAQQFIGQHDGAEAPPQGVVPMAQGRSSSGTPASSAHRRNDAVADAVGSSGAKQPRSARVVVEEWERLEGVRAELVSREESVLRREEQVQQKEKQLQWQQQEILEMRRQLEKYSEEIERQVFVLTQKQQDLTEAKLHTAELQRQLRARLATAIREDVVASSRNAFTFNPGLLGQLRQ